MNTSVTKDTPPLIRVVYDDEQPTGYIEVTKRMFCGQMLLHCIKLTDVLTKKKRSFAAAVALCQTGVYSNLK